QPFAGGSIQLRSPTGHPRRAGGTGDRPGPRPSAGRSGDRRAARISVRAAPAGAMQLETAGNAANRRGVGSQAQGVRTDGRAGTLVGVLHPRGVAARRAGGTQLRSQSDICRGLSTRVPAGHRRAAVKTIAVRHVDRADPAHIAELGRAGTATVHEAIGRSGLLQPYMLPIYPGAAAAGSAITVLAQPGDNWMLHVAVE